MVSALAMVFGAIVQWGCSNITKYLVMANGVLYLCKVLITYGFVMNSIVSGTSKSGYPLRSIVHLLRERIPDSGQYQNIQKMVQEAL